MIRDRSPFKFGPEGGWEREIPSPFSGTVFMLHGLGADGNDFVPVIPYLGLEGDNSLRFLFPNAPVQAVGVNSGMRMRAWYDIRRPDVRKEPDWEGIDASAEKLLGWVEEEEKRGVPRSRIFLAGFSQGGLIVLSAGLSSPKPLGGILALSTYDPSPSSVQDRWKGGGSQPFFMGHGMSDPVIPYKLGKETFESLCAIGWEGTWLEHNEGHTVTLEELKGIGEWLCKSYLP
ncbi:MAG: alpha/beta hydrolase [Leptospirales bacterium]